MNVCSLPREKRQFNDARRLIKDCHSVNCWFVESDFTDLPAGCVLLVAGLLASKREKEEELDRKKKGDDCACDLETLMDCYDGRIPGCMPGVKGPCNCNKGHDDHSAPKETEN